MKEKDKSAFEKIDLLVKDVRNWICAVPYLDRDQIMNSKQPVVVDTIFRGDDSLISLFVSGPFDVSKNNDICFERMPISADLSIPRPVVLISDETELDREGMLRIESRRRVDAPLYPVIIFPDDYFVIKRGDSFSYSDICERFAQAVNVPIIPFRKGDILRNSKYVRAYVSLIDTDVLIWTLKKELERLMGELANEIDALLERRKSCRASSASLLELTVNQKIKAQAGIYKKLEFVRKEMLEHSDEIKGVMRVLREQYDAHIRRIVVKESFTNDSPYAVQMDLKYAQLRKELQNLCSQVSLGLAGGMLEKDAQEIVRDTVELLSSSTAHIAFVGTFSSGKTTMINAMLGHEHPLRTSGKHNTAVLTEICAADQEECYEVIYKSNISWSIIKPVSFASRSICNPLDEETEVAEIQRGKDCNIVKLVAVNSGKQAKISVASGHKLVVSKGTRLYPGDSLIRETESNDVYKLCSGKELQYLRDLFRDAATKRVKLWIDVEEYNGDRARTYLDRIAEALQPYYDEKTLTAELTITKEELRTRLQGVTKIERCITVSCDPMIRKQQRIMLDEESWKRFVGDEETGIMPFVEKPECYIPAERIRVYLKSDFLRYCTITDTPGAGSVTDEHDSITEMYIRKFQGRLFVMIAVNSHPDDMKFNDLLNTISSTYELYGKNKQEVFFVLNCFTSSTPEAFCQKTVRKFVKKIKERNFSDGNIYVCNLRKAVADDADADYMMGRPSYRRLKEHCVQALLQDATKRKYRLICENWKRFFESNCQIADSRRDEFEQSANREKENKESIQREIREVDSMSLINLDDFLRKPKEEYRDVADYLENLFRTEKRSTGILFLHRNRRAKIRECMRECIRPTLSSWHDYPQELYDSVCLQMSRLASYDEKQNLKDDLEKLKEPQQGMMGLSVDSISKLLLDADENTSIMNWDRNADTDAYMRRLHSMITRDYKDFEGEARTYYAILQKRFDARKDAVLQMLKQKEEACEDSEKAKEMARVYTDLCEDLTELREKWYEPINWNG